MHKTQLVFIRHGDHVPTPERKPGESALTPVGIQEGKLIGRRLAADPARTVGFSYGEDRATDTLAHALYPAAPMSEVATLTSRLTASGKIGILTDLNYLAHDNLDFKTAMDKAAEVGQGLAFLAGESDSFITDSSSEVSCYSRTAMQVARAIIKCTRIHTAWVSKPEIANRTQELTRVFCAREFVYPCFRARVIQHLEGSHQRDTYAQWYGENLEHRDEARVSIARIEITSSDDSRSVQLVIADSYGEMTCSLSGLTEIVESYERRIGKR